MAAFVPLGYFGVFSGSDVDVSGRKNINLKKLVTDNRSLLGLKIFYLMRYKN